MPTAKTSSPCTSKSRSRTSHLNTLGVTSTYSTPYSQAFCLTKSPKAFDAGLVLCIPAGRRRLCDGRVEECYCGIPDSDALVPSDIKRYRRCCFTDQQTGHRQLGCVLDDIVVLVGVALFRRQPASYASLPDVVQSRSPHHLSSCPRLWHDL